MDLDNYLSFAMGSMLVCIGIIFISLTLVFLNNLFSKYWKTVKIVEFIPRETFAPARFVEPHELEKTNEPQLKEVK
jgi:hypothetical protein